MPSELIEMKVPGYGLTPILSHLLTAAVFSLVTLFRAVYKLNFRILKKKAINKLIAFK